MNCVYLKKETKDKTLLGLPIYQCDLHGQCVIESPPREIASCNNCKTKLLPTDSDLKTKFEDHLQILDRKMVPTHSLRNLLAGRAAFLVCGGPGANQLELETLNRRGIWSMAVNNMAGHPRFRPSAFICSDPPLKFHHGIWLDPTIMKFVPVVKFKATRSSLKRKVDDENFVPLTFDGNDVKVPDCPNVWAFGRRSWMQLDDSFFLEHEAAWGNHSSGVARTGLEKTVNTMLLAIRLMYYLGCRTIYLLGVDFYMAPAPSEGVTGNYAFGELRDKSAVDTNNEQFRVVNGWLTKMQTDGLFDRFGLKIFNCNEKTQLRAFYRVPFSTAVEDVLREFPSEPFDLKNWYAKKGSKDDKK